MTEYLLFLAPPEGWKITKQEMSLFKQNLEKQGWKEYSKDEVILKFERDN